LPAQDLLLSTINATKGIICKSFNDKGLYLQKRRGGFHMTGRMPEIMQKKKKQKFLVWITIIITAVNFLLAIAFIAYLYFWVRGR